MARLILAVIFIAILLGTLAVVATGLRAAFSRPAPSPGRAVDVARPGMLPKISYALLVALIFYVGVGGGG